MISIKNLRIISIFVLLLGVIGCSNSVYENRIKDWTVYLDKESNALTLSYQDKVILDKVVSRYKIGDEYITTTQYPKVSLRFENIQDEIGTGKKMTYTYSGLEKHPNVNQVFYFYDGQQELLTEIELLSQDTIRSNYLAPIYSETKNSFLEKDSTNRVLTVPFDNDSFVTYRSNPLSVEDTSSEVTAIFNGENRQGLIIGSVEHDTWKTGVKFVTSDDHVLDVLDVFGGLANEMTRDVSDREDCPSSVHGYVKGEIIKSPKIFLGYFSDWRRGLETFGEICALIAPPRKWNKATPFGWNSWAAMAHQVNYEGAIDVSDFFKSDLEKNNFSNDNTVYIGLDSFWDNFTPEQLKQFVKHCNANGQKAGIYWCPFSDWHGNADAYVEGTNNKWQYKDIYLYAENGKPKKIESLAVDPTHPATKMRMEHYINMFKKLGYEYVKLDFINNGTLEASSFYNPEVTTGKQAYNEGMSYLSDLCGENMFLALSIAPTFPAQYGTSKRISCDAWGAMTEGGAGTTGYMLNSLSYGWWLDRVYPFNDADHILLYQPNEASNYQLGANRARITSAVITGIYMLGDNFSQKGSLKGDEEARNRARIVATNHDINEIAKIGKSFYPVNGYLASAPDRTETQFMYQTEDTTYLVIFNFDTDKESVGNVNLSKLGIDSNLDLSVKELWTSEYSMIEDEQVNFSVPAQDVRVYKIQH